MTNSVPSAKTLSIVTGDIINYKGQSYVITNVTSADNGTGQINYTVTISAAVLVCNYNNTVISSKAPLSVAGARINASYWVQSGNA